MPLRRLASVALVAVLGVTPALVAAESASAAYDPPFQGVSLYVDEYIDSQLGAMTVGVPYSDSITRGAGYVNWDRLGTLPPGLHGVADGESFVISGTPTTAGDYNIALYSYGQTNDYMAFYMTVVDAPPAQLRPVIDAGSPAPIVTPGGSFTAGFSYVNDSPSAEALNPTVVITVSAGATLSGDPQGNWLCDETPTVVSCTLPWPIAPGASGTAYSANVALDAGYATPTFTVTTAASATNSAAQSVTQTVHVNLPAPLVVAPVSSPYSDVTVSAYAPFGETGQEMQFQFTAGALVEEHWATVDANGVGTYSGPISSAFNGTNVSVITVYYSALTGNMNAASYPTVYVYKQANMAGNFYLNGALYTGQVNVYVYSDYYYDGSVGVFDQFWYLTGGSYNVTPTGPLTYSYYAWADLYDLGSLRTYYNAAGDYMPSEDNHTTLSTSTFSDGLNFYWELPPTFTDEAMVEPRENVAFTDAVVATSNVDVDYRVSTGDLPDGLTLDEETGAITGTATTEGEDYSFRVEADNGYLTVESAVISGTVQAEHALPVWTDSTVATVRANQTVVEGVAASGDSTIAYEVSDGALPTGVTFTQATGQLSGVPTVPGEQYSFELRAFNTWGEVFVTISGTVLAAYAAPVWTDSAIGELRVGETLTDDVTATGEPTPTYTSLDLPAWVTLDATSGAITATPTAEDSYDFTITATNTQGTVSQRFTGTVLPQWIEPTFTDDSIAQLQGGVYLDDQVLATGDGTIVYSVALATMPAWLTLNSASGLISGTAPLSAVGDPYSFTVTATSPYGSDTATITGVVAGAPNVEITLGFAVGDVAAGAPFDFEVTGAGDTVPYSVTVNSTPVIVASGSTNALGSASGTATLPAGIAVGSHSIVLLTFASDGTSRSVTVWFTVLRNGTVGEISLLGPLAYSEAALARTGLDIELPLAASLLLLVLGAAFIARRRSQQA